MFSIETLFASLQIQNLIVRSCINKKERAIEFAPVQRWKFIFSTVGSGSYARAHMKIEVSICFGCRHRCKFHRGGQMSSPWVSCWPGLNAIGMWHTFWRRTKQIGLLCLPLELKSRNNTFCSSRKKVNLLAN